MNNLRRLRFRLSSLLIVTTSIVLLVSFSQWRRQNILQEVEEISRLGGQVNVANDYRDFLWQRRPTSGSISLAFRDADRKRKVEVIEDRMKNMGVTSVKVYYSF